MRVSRVGAVSRWACGGGLVAIVSVLYSTIETRTGGLFWAAWTDPYVYLIENIL